MHIKETVTVTGLTWEVYIFFNINKDEDRTLRKTCVWKEEEEEEEEVMGRPLSLPRSRLLPTHTGRASLKAQEHPQMKQGQGKGQCPAQHPTDSVGKRSQVNREATAQDWP